MNFLDYLIIILNLAYLILLTREVIWAWPAGILGSALLIWIAWQQNLYSDMALYGYYVVMGVWGWYLWSQGEKKQAIPIQRISPKEVALMGGLGMVGMVILRYTLGNIPGASLPWLDAFTTSFSLIGTYLQAKKYLENWLLWIVVNGMYIGIYAYKEVWSVSLLSIVYLFMSIYGYRYWLTLFRSRQTT